MAGMRYEEALNVEWGMCMSEYTHDSVSRVELARVLVLSKGF